MVLQRFRRAYNAPWSGATSQRYVNDGRPFWYKVVAASVQSDCPQLAEDLYLYYQRPEAWRLADGAQHALQRLRSAGYRTACVSNFDTRLRPLLAAMGVAHLFDAIVVSAEVGVEKPCRVIYEHALEALGVPPEAALHVGDDRRNDVWGARDAGIAAWLWGTDVRSFDELADRVLRGGAVGCHPALWRFDTE